MRPELGQNRARELAYARFWVSLPDAEDVLHDAYEIALRREPKPTRLRLAIKQSACRFMAARARGWTTLGPQAEQVPARRRPLELRLDLARAADPVDVQTMVELEGGARAPSRANARALRRARRRLRNCLTVIETC